MDVGEAHVAAVEEVGEALVVKAQQVQHRGVNVVVGDHLFSGLVAELVARSDHLPALDSGSGHP